MGKMKEHWLQKSEVEDWMKATREAMKEWTDTLPIGSENTNPIKEEVVEIKKEKFPDWPFKDLCVDE